MIMNAILFHELDIDCAMYCNRLSRTMMSCHSFFNTVFILILLHKRHHMVSGETRKAHYVQCFLVFKFNVAILLHTSRNKKCTALENQSAMCSTKLYFFHCIIALFVFLFAHLICKLYLRETGSHMNLGCRW